MSERIRADERATGGTVHAVIFKQEGWWVAVCLEHYFATQARSLVEIDYQLQRSLVGYLAIAKDQGAAPFEGLPPAPKKYWDMFNAAERLPRTVRAFDFPAESHEPVPELGLFLSEAA